MEYKTTEARRRANAKYDARMARNLTVKFNRETDADILEYLEQQTSKAALIKQAIRDYIATEKIIEKARQDGLIGKEKAD